ncbi:MAG: hypothetical protein H8D47_05580 [Planctomycetes bacterium]|nr:hypothetical protein [Planctomycetota bacterium]MBL7106963.1 hypothetical protein [Phycisphaerae bacterium]
MNSDTQSIAINCEFGKLYNFISEPGNIPEWMPQFCSSVERNGDGWVAQTAAGKVKLFCKTNREYGIIDYEFKPVLPIKFILHSRVLSNSRACVFVMTHFKLPFTSDEIFEKQKNKVTEQLGMLKNFMEKD